MLVFWLLSKYLERKDQLQFRHIWETKVLGHVQRHFFWMMIHFIAGVYVISRFFLINNESFLMELLVFFFVIVVYGGVYLRTVLRFFSLQNKRYMESTFGTFQDEFDKSNVVYEEKKR